MDSIPRKQQIKMRAFEIKSLNAAEPENSCIAGLKMLNLLMAGGSNRSY
jgi:hypothetical protein